MIGPADHEREWITSTMNARRRQAASLADLIADTEDRIADTYEEQRR